MFIGFSDQVFSGHCISFFVLEFDSNKRIGTWSLGEREDLEGIGERRVFLPGFYSCHHMVECQGCPSKVPSPFPASTPTTVFLSTTAHCPGWQLTALKTCCRAESSSFSKGVQRTQRNERSVSLRHGQNDIPQVRD